MEKVSTPRAVRRMERAQSPSSSARVPRARCRCQRCLYPIAGLALSDMTLTRGNSRASLFLALTNTNSVARPSKEGLSTGESGTPRFAPAMGPTQGTEGRSEGTAGSTLDLHPRSCQGHRGRNGKGLRAPWTVANAAWGQ